MESSESGQALATLGEDLFVLSIRPRDGKLMTRGRIDLGLMGSELVRLAAAGRVRITEGRIAVLDRTATGDAEVDAALLSLIAAPFPPRPAMWVGLPRPGIRDAYAARLISAGALRVTPSRMFGTSRYQLMDSARLAAARSRLDPVTRAAGPPADPAPAALGGLAWAVGLGGLLYPGGGGRDRRARMGQLARQEVITHSTAAISSGHMPPAGPPGGAGPAAPAPEVAGAREGAEADADLAVLAGTQDAIAAAVHAVTAVVENGAVISSQILGAHGAATHPPAGHGGDGHDDSAHGHGGHAGFGGFGGFGHH